MKPDFSYLDKVVPVPYGNVRRCGSKKKVKKQNKRQKSPCKDGYLTPPKILSCRFCEYLLSPLPMRLLKGKLDRERLAKKIPLICFYCDLSLELESQDPNAPNLATVDHIIPKSKGGRNHWTNKVFACPECNHIKKGNRLPTSEELKKLETWRL